MSAIIAWATHNIADGAVLSAEVGAYVDPDHPLEHAQQRGLARGFRTATAQTQFTIYLDNTLPASGVLDETFALDEEFGIAPPPGARTGISALVTRPNGRTVFAGINDENKYIVSEVKRDGSRYLKTGIHEVTYDEVKALALEANGSILVGGSIFGFSDGPGGGTTIRHLIRITPIGRVDTAFDAGFDQGAVRAIAVQPNKQILVAGVFSFVGGGGSVHLVRLNPDGSIDPTFNPVFDSMVTCLALQDDGRILVGGNFTTANGVARHHMARLNPDGTLDTEFVDPRVNDLPGVIALQADGRIVLGGWEIMSVGGQVRHGLARLNPDGTLDPDFDPNCNYDVYAILVQANGQIIVGGNFTSIGGVARENLARLHQDGSVDESFDVDVNGLGITAIADGGEGEIVIGGRFDLIGGVNRTAMARVSTTGPRNARLFALLGLEVDVGSISLSWRTHAGRPWQQVLEHELVRRNNVNTGLPNNLIATLPDNVPIGAQFRIQYRVSTAQLFGFSRLWIGDALVLPDGIDSGWSMSFRDTGAVDASAGRQWYESKGVRTRVLTIPLESARDTMTAWGFDETGGTQPMSLHSLQFECGTTGEVLVIPRTHTDDWIAAAAVYGHIEQPWSIGHKAGPYWGSTITVVEER